MSIAKAAEEILGHDLFTVRKGVVYLDDTDEPVSDQLMVDITARSQILDLPMQTYEEAEATLLEWVEGLLSKIKGPVLREEETGWPEKAIAAEAYLAGTATDDQKATFEDEAEITKENPAALAAVVIAKAKVYRPLIRKTTGLRRVTLTALQAASTPQERIAVLENAKQTAFAMLQKEGISLE